MFVSCALVFAFVCLCAVVFVLVAFRFVCFACVLFASVRSFVCAVVCVCVCVFVLCGSFVFVLMCFCACLCASVRLCAPQKGVLCLYAHVRSPTSRARLPTF